MGGWDLVWSHRHIEKLFTNLKMGGGWVGKNFIEVEEYKVTHYQSAHLAISSISSSLFYYLCYLKRGSLKYFGAHYEDEGNNKNCFPEKCTHTHTTAKNN